MPTDWPTVTAQIAATLAAALIAFLAARYAADRAITRNAATQGHQYTIAIRAEIRSLRLLLKRVLDTPVPAPGSGAPGGVRYELPYYGEPLKYAPMYLSIDHQYPGVSDDTLERVHAFYSGLLHMRQEAMAMGGAIFYVHRAELAGVVDLAERALEELDKERLKLSNSKSKDRA